MKILFTAGARRHVDENASGRIRGSTYVRHALRAAGHTVDSRITEVGEDLSKYDLIWMIWPYALSFNTAPGALGLLWAWGCGHAPIVAFMDDWAFKQGFTHARTIARSPEKYLLKTIGEGSRLFPQSTAIDKDRSLLEKLGNAAHNIGYAKTWRNRVIVHLMFPWGDHSMVTKLMPEGVRCEYLDPSGYAATEADVSSYGRARAKARRWCMASLVDHSDWIEEQKLGWPVQVYGPKRIGADMQLSSEAEVLREYDNHWGVLSGPYHHAGSGWWRRRYLQAAWCRSVLLCEPKDQVGPGYQLSASAVEQMSDLELRGFAERQADYVLGKTWTIQRFQETADRISREAVHS